MRVWLATVGEPLPTDGRDERLLRAGIVARRLVDADHSVVWWTSTFDHARKRLRFHANTVLDVNPSFRIRLLHGGAYRRAVSARRMLNHWRIGRAFSRLAPTEPRPDIIFCSLPILELCLEATRYGMRHGVPVVADVRDLWPDLFLEVVPRWSHRAARLLLAPYFRMASRGLGRATAVTGLTDKYVGWGLEYAGRARGYWDRVFPLGYPSARPSPEAIAEAESFWRTCGLVPDCSDFTVCYFGNMSRIYELETIIAGARVLQDSGRAFRFILCGDGDKLGELRRRAADLRNVFLPGRVGRPEIWVAMGMAHVGLTPYRSIHNYVNNLPNKPIEYLSGGLAIVSSLKGVLQELLAENACGITYENGDVDGFVSAVTRLHDDAALLRSMSRNASRLFRQRFTAEKVYGALVDYLEELASACSTRGMTTRASLPASPVSEGL